MVDPHAFMDALREFHHSQGEDLKAPIFNRRVMDLEKLWELVFAHGGSAQVCLKKRWASIGRCFNPPPSMTNLSFHIKRIFERYLLPFEQLHFPDRAMKASADRSCDSSSSSSAASSLSASCSSPPATKSVETVSPAFDQPTYIPKKKRSKLSRDSRYGQKKQKACGLDGKHKTKRTFFGKTINPKEFAMPQTLVRTSTALNVDDCEIQAASALQQMKGVPSLTTASTITSSNATTNGLPPVIGPPSFLEMGSGYRHAECMPALRPLESPRFDQSFLSSAPVHDTLQRTLVADTAATATSDIYLSNGIRVIPIKPVPDGFFPISIERPTPELRPTSLVIPPSMSHVEMTPNMSIVEDTKTKEIERLRKQVQHMQSVILRQESKIQAAESSYVECKNCFQAIVAQMQPASVPMQSNELRSSQTQPPSLLPPTQDIHSTGITDPN